MVYFNMFFPHCFQLLRKLLTLNLPTTTIVAQPFNIIKWQLKFNPVA